VAELCRLWKGSPPLNSSSDLHRTPAGAQHELTPPTSNYLVLQHPYSLCVSSPSESGLALPSILFLAPPRDHRWHDPQLRPPPTPKSSPPSTKTGYKSHSPRGGFLQIAVSEAPKAQSCDL
jgi:hypothetical protein